MIEVEARFVDRKENPAKPKQIERVLRDRETFGKIRDLLLAPTAQVRAVPVQRGFTATAAWVILDFKDAAGKRIGALTWQDLDTFVFDPGGWFEVDRKTGAALLQLFVLHGEQVK